MIRRFKVWLFWFNVKLVAVLMLVWLLLGLTTYTKPGLGYILNSPQIEVTKPNTDEVIGVIRPVRIAAMSARLTIDWAARELR